MADPRIVPLEEEAICRLDENGHELLDPTPLAPPVGYQRTPSLAEQIRQMVMSERLRQEVESAGYETFEEADDFEVEDFDPTSPYEEHFDPTPIAELRRRLAEAEAAEAARSQGAPQGTAGGGAPASLTPQS